mgnify:CR=1 FL=1
MTSAQEKFRDQSLPIEERVEDLLQRLTLDEKFRLLSGRRIWTTKPIKRLNIPPMGTTDGPNGVAFHSSFKRNTLFPTSICLAATWNRALSFRYGDAIGKETRASGRHMILAPGINIDRTPMNGRTFEYLTEDPYLNAEMAIPYVKGVQKNKISACVKHYAANNQETKRFSVSAEIAERPLHEIYLRSFKEVTERADPWAFMACYNRINGVYGCENSFLLNDLLKNEWGFRGLVVSDWFASKQVEKTENCVNGGLTLEMPISIRYKKRRLRKAFEENKFSKEALDDLVRRNLRVMVLVGLFDPPNEVPVGERNTPEHREIARKMAAEGIVLLKNENNILPLDKTKIHNIAVKGPNACKRMGKPLYGGSSAVWPPYEITPYKGIKAKCKGSVSFVETPSSADAVIVIAGLDHKGGKDSENKDKERFPLPESQIELINKVAKENANTIVVLISGSPVSMDRWIDNVAAVVEAWYPGMEGGNVIADVLFGDINPSGKLPITFPKKLSDSPAHQSNETWPGNDKVYYKEGIFVGYRYFDEKSIEPLFPFGFGLSYTKFAIQNLKMNTNELTGDGEISVTADVENIGEIAGAEVVQMYISHADPPIERPPKELKGFEKVYLKPNDSATVEFAISKKDLEYYNPDEHRWVASPGQYKILVGNSSRNIQLKGQFSYK